MRNSVLDIGQHCAVPPGRGHGAHVLICESDFRCSCGDPSWISLHIRWHVYIHVHAHAYAHVKLGLTSYSMVLPTCAVRPNGAIGHKAHSHQHKIKAYTCPEQRVVDEAAFLPIDRLVMGAAFLFCSIFLLLYTPERLRS